MASIRQFSGLIEKNMTPIILFQTPGAYQVRDIFSASPDHKALILRNAAYPHLRDKTQDRGHLFPAAIKGVTTSGAIGSGPDFARQTPDILGISR